MKDLCELRLKIWGAESLKDIPALPKGTPALYMYTHYGHKSCKFLDKWNRYTRDYFSRQFPLEGTFDLSESVHLCRDLELRGSNIPQTQWDTFF